MRFQLETVGKPPSHWDCVRNKTLFRGIDDRSDDGSEELLTVSHLTGVTRRSEKDVYMFMAESLEGYKRCQPGDLVINTMWAWMGALGVSPLHGVVSPSYHVYRPSGRNVEPRYFDYLFRTKAYVAEITRNSRGVWTSRLRLYPDVFLDMESLLPPLEEQTAIADFLDRKTAAIDVLIEKKERLVALLAEKHATLIHRAVTIGLEPDATMKDSRVDWIGKIPAHWEVKPLKRLVSHVVDCHHSTPAYEPDAPYPALRTTDVRSGWLDLDGARRVLEDEYSHRISRLKPAAGDIVFSREGDWGRAALVPKGVELCLAQRVMLLRVIPAISSSFLTWSLNSTCVYNQLAVHVVSTTAPHVNISDIREVLIPVPPSTEQKLVAQWLDSAFASTRAVQEELEHSQGTLGEYRQSLITAAVTGQIDVRSDSMAGVPLDSAEEVIA